MPIYDYKCIKCGEKFDAYRSFLASDKSVKCPKCGEPNPERQLGTFTSKVAGGGSALPKSRYT